MSSKLKKKLEKQAQAQAAKELNDSKKVLMLFPENMYYNDLDKPIFEKGKTYELEGADWIYRWKKRGGIVVESAEKIAVPAKQDDVKTTEDLAPEVVAHEEVSAEEDLEAEDSEELKHVEDEQE